MNMNQKSCWPTNKQLLLLRAALFKGDIGLKSWQKWKEEDLDLIDAGSLRLIPLLYQNLLNHNVKDPILSRYKGVYRHYWARNRLLIASIIPIIQALNKEGIEVLIFKGLGLILSLELDAALRPMDDIDILIKPEDFSKALSIIKKLGWKPKDGIDYKLHEFTNEVSFRNDKGKFIDVHLHSLMYCKWGIHENEFWKRSKVKNLNGVSVRVIDDTDNLIHIIVHGLGWNSISPIRWISDSMLIFENTSHNIEWDYLIEQSKRLHVVLPMLKGLSYLKKEFNASIPEYVISNLKSYKVSFWEKLVFNLRTRILISPYINGMFLRILVYYSFRKTYTSPGFLRYLQTIWGLDHFWQVPFVGMKKLLKHFIIILKNKNTK